MKIKFLFLFSLSFVFVMSCSLIVSFDKNENEICTNSIDDDGDGKIDCEDSDCIGDPACGSLYEICNNTVDDDGDGKIDCEDSDCATDSHCAGEVEICNDGDDNDGDTLIDCADPDCDGAPACSISGEVCDNGADDDGDGFIDCADPDCQSDSACIESICDDGNDNDSDGFIDCEDSDCYEAPFCNPEICDGGFDDDGDGLVDCSDPDCFGDYYTCACTLLGAEYDVAHEDTMCPLTSQICTYDTGGTFKLPDVYSTCNDENSIADSPFYGPCEPVQDGSVVAGCPKGSTCLRVGIGYMCVPLVVNPEAVSSAAPCPDYNTGVYALPYDIPGNNNLKVCYPEGISSSLGQLCDPFNILNSCDAGRRCMVINNSTNNFILSCLEDGSLSEGESCYPNSDFCKAGFMCISEGNTVQGTCRKLCDTAISQNCPSGQHCDYSYGKLGVCMHNQ